MSTTALEEPCVENALGGYYDPTTAQFTTPDPLFAITGSRYGYAGNDPINGSDPTGLWCPIGQNSNGSCRGSGLVPNCVTIGNRNCESIGSTHEGLRDTLGVIAGAAAFATGVGALAEGATALGVGLGATSVLAGGTASALDYGPCVHEHDQVACTALATGSIGAFVGLGATGGVLLGASEVSTLFIGLQGLIPGFIGTSLDLLRLVAPDVSDARCR